MIDLESLMDQLEEAEALLLEPREHFDKAIVGITDGGSGARVAVYDAGKCIGSLMAGNDWDFETAQEWYEFNIADAYLGAGTPLFIDLLVHA
jgi:hypothetical protein